MYAVNIREFDVYRLQGEPVNLREQQDAVEFFMSLVESLDEALKALGHEQIMGKILGGSYSDQKICKGCPHRYLFSSYIFLSSVNCNTALHYLQIFQRRTVQCDKRGHTESQ